MMKKLAGVLLWTVLNEGGNTPCAIFQARGRHNFRRGIPQTHRGVLQVTAEGKKENHETDVAAAIRELMEEVGPGTGFAVSNIISDPARYLLLPQHRNGGIEVVTYEHFVPPAALRHLRLESSSGGLVMLTETEVETMTADYIPNEPPIMTAERCAGKLLAMPEARQAAFSLFKDIRDGRIKIPMVVSD